MRVTKSSLNLVLSMQIEQTVAHIVLSFSNSQSFNQFDTGNCCVFRLNILFLINEGKIVIIIILSGWDSSEVCTPLHCSQSKPEAQVCCLTYFQRTTEGKISQILIHRNPVYQMNYITLGQPPIISLFPAFLTLKSTTKFLAMRLHLVPVNIDKYNKQNTPNSSYLCTPHRNQSVQH